MLACTFFGHRECPASVKPLLVDAIRELIEREDVTLFYLGNQGQFDAYAAGALQELAERYPHIRYAVVLAYLPGPGAAIEDDTMLPERLETVHPRYAIDRRNRWMLERAEYVVTYITHSWGGAARFAELARRRGKTVIELGSKKLDKQNHRSLPETR